MDFELYLQWSFPLHFLCNYPCLNIPLFTNAFDCILDLDNWELYSQFYFHLCILAYVLTHIPITFKSVYKDETGWHSSVVAAGVRQVNAFCHLKCSSCNFIFETFHYSVVNHVPTYCMHFCPNFVTHSQQNSTFYNKSLWFFPLICWNQGTYFHS